MVDTANLRNSSFDEFILQYILVANTQTDISCFVIRMVTLVNMEEMTCPTNVTQKFSRMNVQYNSSKICKEEWPSWKS